MNINGNKNNKTIFVPKQQPSEVSSKSNGLATEQLINRRSASEVYWSCKCQSPLLYSICTYVCLFTCTRSSIINKLVNQLKLSAHSSIKYLETSHSHRFAYIGCTTEAMPTEQSINEHPMLPVKNFLCVKEIYYISNLYRHIDYSFF